LQKGYVIALVSVTDVDRYAEYRMLASDAIAAYGGTVLVRGGQSEILEGLGPARIVVVEFADIETARQFYRSPGYSMARKARAGAADVNMVLVEGV
jgi:uncharacterized protein (DUF1330 family)